MCVCVCVCVCEREREREREICGAAYRGQHKWFDSSGAVIIGRGKLPNMGSGMRVLCLLRVPRVY